MPTSPLPDAQEIDRINRALLFSLPVGPVVNAIGIGCGSVCWWVADRLAGLWRDGQIAGRIFVSGGAGIVADDPEHAVLRDQLVLSRIDLPGVSETEAEYMARLLLAAGVPRERIVIENDSRNTGENLAFCRRLGAFDGAWMEQPPARVAFVCAPYHSRRLLGTARALLGGAALPALTTIPAWPLGLTAENWHHSPFAARIAREELVRLETYTQSGVCLPVALDAEEAAFAASAALAVH